MSILGQGEPITDKGAVSTFVLPKYRMAETSSIRYRIAWKSEKPKFNAQKQRAARDCAPEYWTVNPKLGYLSRTDSIFPTLLGCHLLAPVSAVTLRSGCHPVVSRGVCWSVLVCAGMCWYVRYPGGFRAAGT
jgi:hypothetical protein